MFAYGAGAAGAIVAGPGAVRLRSLLFVPGDRPDRMEKALESGPDGADPGFGGFGGERRASLPRARRWPRFWVVSGVACSFSCG